MISLALMDLARDLINTYGSTIILKTKTKSYNTDTGRMEETVVSSDPIKASIESYSSEHIQGLIQSGDMKVTIANDNTIIDTNTKISFNSIDYSIINIEPTYAEDNIITYDIQIRR